MSSRNWKEKHRADYHQDGLQEWTLTVCSVVECYGVDVCCDFHAILRERIQEEQKEQERVTERGVVGVPCPV